MSGGIAAVHEAVLACTRGRGAAEESSPMLGRLERPDTGRESRRRYVVFGSPTPGGVGQTWDGEVTVRRLAGLLIRSATAR